MRAVDFEGRNKVYGKPKNMTDEECYELPVYVHRNEEGEIVFINSVWMPNKEDLEAINAGRGIIVQHGGNFLQPHALYTVDENGESNNVDNL